MKKINIKNKIILRSMLLEDAQQVSAIDKQVSEDPWTEGLFRDCVVVGYSCWVYEENHKIIGYGLLSCAAGEAHVLNIGIMPIKQGQGLGKRMMRHLIKVAKGLGANIIYLEVRVSNYIAKKLYNELSFIEIGLRKGYYPNKNGSREDAIMLALNLI